MKELAASTALIGLAILLTELRRLGLGKDLLKGTVRSFLQLMAVGYVLKIVFDLERLPYQMLLLVVMVTIAAFTARARARSMQHGFAISFFSILCGLGSTLGIMLGLRIINTEPTYLIPLGGMIIGNSMNAVSLGFERISSEVKTRKGEIEAALSLGTTPQRAIEPIVKKSLRASLIPLMNLMRIVGVVQLPGAMTGMLLAGAKPIEAAQIQLIVIYMLGASVTISVLVSSFFTYRGFFNKAWQLVLNQG